jgi:transposase
MARHSLSDRQWEKLSVHLPKSRTGPQSKLGDRLFIDAVLYRAKTGIPWRDLPERFGPWKSVYNRFDNWSKKGVWGRLFRALQIEVDDSFSIADGSVVRAHQDSAGGKGGFKSTLLDVLAEAYQRKSTQSLMRRLDRSTW